jgi:photosystem II stability/assembly factor-like uncharacterized protein
MGRDTSSHMPTGSVIMTTDGGSTWILQDPNTTSMLRAIYFSDAYNGYACGMGGVVVRTTDGGTTWDSSGVGGSNPNDQLNTVSFPSNGQTGYIGPTSTNYLAPAYVYKSGNGGTSWGLTPVGGPLDQTYGCAMANDDIGVAFGPNALAYTTTDGFGSGKYTDLQAPNCNMTAAAYSPSDNNKAYLVGNDTALARGIVRFTATGGSPTWDSVKCPVVASLSCVDYASPETAYVGGANGFIGGTHDPHDIWTTNTGVTNQINSICFPNGPDTGYAAAGQIILKSVDAGFPWSPAVAEGKAPATLLSGIRVVANPGRFGIALRSDANVTVTVFDAAGRAVLTATANRGLNLLPVRKAGAYFVRSGEHTVRAVVTD